MKAKEISVELLVNTGNYENFKIGGVYTLEENENELECIQKAFKRIKSMTSVLKVLECNINTKPFLTEDNPRFERAKKALAEGLTTIEQIEQHFQLSAEIKNLLTNKN